MKLIVITGPTACGKTRLAVHLAHNLSGEIISADSRQVYRGMDIGTGKDLEEYRINGVDIPYHLIDIKDPGYEYNVFEYQKDFYKVYEDLTNRSVQPIICGGTGMYIDAILKGYEMVPVPPDPAFRSKMEFLAHEVLIDELSKKRKLHNTTDISSKKRTIRALEIAQYYERNNIEPKEYPSVDAIIFGLDVNREEVKRRITFRLKQRMKHGLIEEVEMLLASGISPEKLKYYGLEYKFVTMYLNGELLRNELFEKLNTAIHQFSKRQMTWFRKMEKEGTKIHWLNGELEVNDQMSLIMSRLKK